MKYLVAIVLLSIFAQSCSDCNRVDCIGDDRFQFNILSLQSNENLVFGPNPVIEKGDIQVFFINGGERKSETVNFHSNSFIHFSPHISQSEYFLEAAGKIDTLLFTFGRSGKSECCGPVNLITQIMVNNVIQTPDSTGIIELFR